MEKLKISIITSVYNNKDTIKDAIKSVLNQTYKNIEYIVVDGGSTDGTVEVIKQYEDKIDKFISEPDKGIYDGLNKGIKLATGDVIAFLHSDDIYPDNNTIEKIMNLFNKDNVDGVYGDLIYVKKDDINKIIRYWKSCDFNADLLKKGWMPAHPTLFLKKEIYEKYGVFDLNFKIAGDYDFMLRILKENPKLKYLPEVLYVMRVGGESNKSLKNIVNKSKEDYIALKRNHIGGIGTLFLKNLQKINQFFKN
jgi:glycosyltransferase involved in cell wall biosynthesis